MRVVLRNFRNALCVLPLALTACPLAAEEVRPAVIVLEDLGGDFNFDVDLWVDAEVEAGSDRVRSVYGAGIRGIREGEALAQRLGWGDTIFDLSTANTKAETSEEFNSQFSEIRSGIEGQQERFANWTLHYEWPMCALLSMPGVQEGYPRDYMLVVSGGSEGRKLCYSGVMHYFSSPPSEDGIIPPPIFIDAQAVAAQMIMPPLEVTSAYLALKEQDDNGRYLERETATYAPNEEIFIRAFLANVGRHMVGTSLANFELRLDLELRDMAGELIQRTDELYVYKGTSFQHFPVSKKQFLNDITAGVSVPSEGEYQLAFIFTDLSRPEDETAPAEAVFNVLIE